MIEAKSLVRRFKSGEDFIYAIKDVSFKVESGEFVAITGRSGSGKSTLMYQLGLLDHPTSGQIIIDGVDVSNFGEKERTSLRLNSLGYIFQDYALIPELTAFENVLVPLLMQGLLVEEAKLKAKKSLERIGLGDRLEHLPSMLSGGQQQRVAIARAIAHEPKIIFADEPTANLDSESSLLVIKNFIELNKEGQTILMVTHEQEYAKMSDRVITLSDGKIESDTKHRHHAKN
jgi:ABC-type antimicrobial peptide transport system, ATPase component